MSDSERAPHVLTVSEIRQQLSQVLGDVFERKGRVIIERGGLPVAALVSLDDLRRLEQREAEHAADKRAVGEMAGLFGDIPDDLLAEEIAACLIEVRQEKRARRKQP